MRRYVSIWPVAALIGCLLAAFLWSSGQLHSSIKDADDKFNQSRVQLTRLQNEQVSLNDMLNTVGTESFIEYQARTKFGYMKKDEIRFVITNPEVLYGTEELQAD